MKSVKLFFFLHVFLFFSLPPAFSAELKSIDTSSTIVCKSSLSQWTQTEVAQNEDLNLEIDEENLDGDGVENLHAASFVFFPVRHKIFVFSNQTRFPWNPFQSYYSRLTNSPPSSYLI